MNLLSFLSRYLGFLKTVPGLPQAFDGAVLLWKFITCPRLLDWLDEIREEVTTWPGVTVAVHRFGGTEYRNGNKEIGHIHSNGILDIRFPKIMRNELLHSEVVHLHHTLPTSNWTSFLLVDATDVATAIYLLQLSYNIRCCKKLVPSKKRCLKKTVPDYLFAASHSWQMKFDKENPTLNCPL